MHFIETDLKWMGLGIHEQTLVWEIEQYLAKVARFNELYPEETR